LRTRVRQETRMKRWEEEKVSFVARRRRRGALTQPYYFTDSPPFSYARPADDSDLEDSGGEDDALEATNLLQKLEVVLGKQMAVFRDRYKANVGPKHLKVLYRNAKRRLAELKREEREVGSVRWKAPSSSAASAGGRTVGPRYL
jgi:hypothetical protein